jgi:FkbM family methyltransferase
MNFDIQNEKEQGIYDEIWVDKVYGDVEPGWTVLDIGANIGFFTLFALEAGARVYAYEPEEKNFERLEQQIIQNLDDPEHAHVYRLAVASDDEGRNLYLNAENIGGHRITHDAGGGIQRVPSITLNQIIEEVGHVDLIKMDCEGAECEIFWVATPETMAKIDRIRMEYHPIRPLPKFLEMMKPYFDIEVRNNKWDNSLPYLWMTKK